MQFTNPIFLWAMTGLSIPVGIHLLSRKEGKVLRLGSLRHVLETSTQQFKGIRLNEILLLIIRCLLVILLVLTISGLTLNLSTNRRWLLMERGLAMGSGLVDSLQREGYEVRLLTQGFPLLKDSASAKPLTSYWKLMNLLAKQNITEAVVLSKNKMDNYLGPRASVPDNVRWISVPQPSHDYTLQILRVSTDTLLIREGHTGPDRTYFTARRVKRSDDINSQPRERIVVAVTKDQKYEYDRRILVAAITAISKSLPIDLTLIDAPDPSHVTKIDWHFWLSDKVMPTSMASGFVNLRAQPSDGLFIRENSNQWIITRRLNEEVALKENLTLSLANILLPEKDLRHAAAEQDRRVMPDALASTVDRNTGMQTGLLTESAQSYLLILILVLLFAERMVAYNRNQ